MNKKNQYTDSVKETLILTLAVAIIAAAVYFFLVPSHASVSSISGLGIILSNFVPLPLSAITMILSASDYRILYMRSGIRSKNCLYKHYASTVSGAF